MSIKLKSTVSVAFFAASLLFFSPVSYAKKPLSCQMFAMLAETSAMLRDQGRTESEVKAILKQGGDLTNKEIQALLETTFKLFKSSPPSEISKIVLAACS